MNINVKIKVFRLSLAIIFSLFTIVIIILHFISNRHEDALDVAITYIALIFGAQFIVSYMVKLPMYFVSGPTLYNNDSSKIFRIIYLLLGIIIYIFCLTILF